MKQIYKLKSNEKVYIIPISDLHVGSDQFNEKYFEYCLDTIDSITSQKRIYLLGDLVESASKSIGNSVFKTTMTVDDQLDYVINRLRPYKREIVNTVKGNHEIRLSKEFDFDINRVIGRALHVPSGTQFTDVIFINRQPVKIYTAHGKGSSAYHYTAQSKIIRDTQHIEADILMHGHNHRCDHFSIPKTTVIDNKLDIIRRHYIFTGSFLRYKGYASDMLLPPLPESFIQLSINKDLRVRSNRFNIDECKHDLMEL
jgi:UDP-2,3-diacylglucosamine pyrophosphatase LpxH